MQIEMLRCFLALAYSHNFSVAAENMYISQSTMSKRILAMEQELNVTLFERTARNVKLTSAGERIFYQIENIVNEYDDMLSCIPDVSEQSRILTVSSMCDMSQYGITKMIIGFELANHGVIAETKEQSHTAMSESLEQNRTICAIGYRELIGSVTGYERRFLKADPLVLVYSKEHSLAKRHSPNLGDAKYFRFCFPKEDRRFFEHILRLCAKVGFAPELTRSDVRISTIREYILQGMRITITTQSRANRIFREPEFIVNPLEEEDVLHLELFIKKDAQDPLYQDFAEYAEQYYRKELLSEVDEDEEREP